jgi:stage II sporulation protein P
MLTRRARHKAKFCLTKKIVFGVVSLFFLCAALWYHGIGEEALPVITTSTLQQEPFGKPQWRDILFLGVPGLGGAAESKSSVKVKRETSIPQLMRETILFFVGVDIKDIRSVLHVEIPVLASVKSSSQTVSAMSLPNFPKFEIANTLPSGKPLVGLYYTHTSESYVPSAGVAHSPGGQRGDIVDVGGALAKRLGTYGISALQNTTIHDYPSFMKAYDASEGTVKKIISENASIQMIFDIHRDADKRENYLVTINGVQAAKIKILVCVGQQDLVQPHWQQNHAFAKLIDAKLNQRYPGLSRGIQIENWRYNQHLHPRALLIEVGCQENSKEEAERGIEMFGDILAEIIDENNKQ